MQMAPPLDTPSVHESLSPVVLDPLHSHQVNVFCPLSVVFCLSGFNGTSAVPVHSTFLVRQHPMNEVFEAVREAKGLLMEGTIPPSYASQTDEKEQLFIKHDVWVDIVVEGEHASFAVEMLKNISLKKDIRGMEGEEKNGADETQKEEKCDSLTEILPSMPSPYPSPSLPSPLLIFPPYPFAPNSLPEKISPPFQ